MGLIADAYKDYDENKFKYANTSPFFQSRPGVLTSKHQASKIKTPSVFSPKAVEAMEMQILRRNIKVAKDKK